MLEHTRALLRHDGLVRAVLLNPLRPAPHLPPDLAAAPEVRWRSVAPAADGDPVAYHVMSPFEMGSPIETLFPPPGLPSDTPIAVTLYDLIPLADPERYLSTRAEALAYRARLSLLRAADVVLAISQHSADEAAARLGIDSSRLHVIGGGVAPSFRPADDPVQAEQRVRRVLPAVTRPFVLSVTGSHDRKNTEGLLDGYALLPPELRAELQLVIACDAPAPWQARWREHARRVGLADEEVVITGYIDDAVLRLLYQSARLFVFPSLSEGFGLPVAEAVACGCPTITSDATSVPEILDWDDSTFDPTSPEALAALTERALTDQGFRVDLRRAGDRAATQTTWEAVAARTVDALDTLRPPSAVVGPSRRLRLALVGPFAPIASGVAGYTQQLLPDLVEGADVDLFLEPGSDGRALGGVARRILPLQRLGRSADPSSYDAIVYAVGNSVHHHATLDAALRFPGIVWLHDVRLHRLVVTWARARHGPAWAAVVDAMIEDQYGPRVPPRPDCDDDERLYEWLADHDVFLTRHLLAASRGAVVHSEEARHLLVLDQPPGAWTPPVQVIPHAVPTPPWASRTPAPTPLIVSMGILHPIKAPEALIRAAARLEEAVDVALVGAVSDSFRIELARLARDEGLRGQLIVPGAASTDDYWGWLQRAWGAVQLRTSWNGESSGAVNDAVAAGVPVATNVPSAADMAGAGAVTMLAPSPTEAEVAAWLHGVVAGNGAGAGQAQRTYAERHSVAEVATGLVAALGRWPSQSGSSSLIRS